MDNKNDNKTKGQEHKTFTPEPPQDMNPSVLPPNEKNKRAKGGTEPRKAEGSKKAKRDKPKPL